MVDPLGPEMVRAAHHEKNLLQAPDLPAASPEEEEGVLQKQLQRKHVKQLIVGLHLWYHERYIVLLVFMKNHKKSFAQQHGPVAGYQYVDLWLFLIWIRKLWHHADVVLT